MLMQVLDIPQIDMTEHGVQSSKLLFLFTLNLTT